MTKREYPRIEAEDLELFTATEIANSVPWDGEFVRADDLERLLETMLSSAEEDVPPWDIA